MVNSILVRRDGANNEQPDKKPKNEVQLETVNKPENMETTESKTDNKQPAEEVFEGSINTVRAIRFDRTKPQMPFCQVTYFEIDEDDPQEFEIKTPIFMPANKCGPKDSQLPEIVNGSGRNNSFEAKEVDENITVWYVRKNKDAKCDVSFNNGKYDVVCATTGPRVGKI